MSHGLSELRVGGERPQVIVQRGEHLEPHSADSLPGTSSMYTRLTGWTVHSVRWCCTQSASSAFELGSSTTWPSTPAVPRPALISVTRRTLDNAFAR